MCDVQALESDYVINQLDDTKWILPELNEKLMDNLPKAIHSQYVDMALRDFISVNENRNYQDYPSTIQRKTLVGKPVSSNEIRTRVDNLESGVYSPMIIDGKLYFIDLEEDVRTALSSPSFESLDVKTAVTSNSFNDDDITFTLTELKSILPSYAIRKLMKHYNVDRMQQKAMTKEQRDLKKVQDAIDTIADFSQRHVPNHPALEPIDLWNTDDPDLVKLRENLIKGPPGGKVAITYKKPSTIPQSTENTTSVTGDTTPPTSSVIRAPTSSVMRAPIKNTADSNYVRKEIGETNVDIEPVPVGRKESKLDTAITGKESPGRTAVSRTIITGALPSDSVHTATLTEAYIDDVETAVEANLKDCWKQCDKPGTDYMPKNKEQFDQMLKTISQEELSLLQTAAVMSPRDRVAFNFMDEIHN